jgi:hypothetical protein
MVGVAKKKLSPAIVENDDVSSTSDYEPSDAEENEEETDTDTPGEEEEDTDCLPTPPPSTRAGEKKKVKSTASPTPNKKSKKTAVAPAVTEPEEEMEEGEEEEEGEVEEEVEEEAEMEQTEVDEDEGNICPPTLPPQRLKVQKVEEKKKNKKRPATPASSATPAASAAKILKKKVPEKAPTSAADVPKQVKKAVAKKTAFAAGAKTGGVGGGKRKKNDDYEILEDADMKIVDMSVTGPKLDRNKFMLDGRVFVRIGTTNVKSTGASYDQLIIGRNVAQGQVGDPFNFQISLRCIAPLIKALQAITRTQEKVAAAAALPAVAKKK